MEDNCVGCSKVKPRGDNHILCLDCAQCTPESRCQACQDWSPESFGVMKAFYENQAPITLSLDGAAQTGAVVGSATTGTSVPRTTATATATTTATSDVQQLTLLPLPPGLQLLPVGLPSAPPLEAGDTSRSRPKSKKKKRRRSSSERSYSRSHRDESSRRSHRSSRRDRAPSRRKRARRHYSSSSSSYSDDSEVSRGQSASFMTRGDTGTSTGDRVASWVNQATPSVAGDQPAAINGAMPPPTAPSATTDARGTNTTGTGTGTASARPNRASNRGIQFRHRARH